MRSYLWSAIAANNPREIDSIMKLNQSCLAVGALVGVVVFLGGSGNAQAQFYPGNPYGYGGYNPYNPYGGYGYGYGGNSAYGVLQGASSYVQAQGQLMLNVQDAKLKQQQVARSALDTKRKTFEEWQYEQANTPTLEETRAKTREQQVLRSRNDPPLTEIWSGKSLNDLLINLKTMPYGSGPTVMLDPDVLKHINVSTGRGAPNGVGLLRADGKLKWPFALQDPLFDGPRNKVTALVPKLVIEARTDDVNAAELRDFMAQVKNLQELLKENVANISSTQWIDASRYVNQLSDATKVLQQTNVSNYFNGTWEPKGNTVGELVDNMIKQGVEFAPASQGDESYYTSLHRSLANYDVALASMCSRPPAEMSTKR